MARGAGRPDTRLSIVFVAAILIPGGFLAYLSLRNIGSQQDLVEKRVFDEEERVAAQLVAALRHELQNCAEAFFDAVDDASFDLRLLVLDSDLEPFVAQPFNLDGDGRFLWPRYVETHPIGDSLPESTGFFAQFSHAEKAEFRGEDPREAARLYRLALNVAGNDSHRAAAVNGLARVLAKDGQVEEASRHYQILLEQYGSIQDLDGITFDRYSIHQLIRLHRSNPGRLSSHVSDLLSRLESGKTPLTSQTFPLLDELTEWLEHNSDTVGVALRDFIRERIALIRRELAFVERSQGLGDLLQSSQSGVNPGVRLGSYEAVAGPDGGDSGLFIIRRDVPEGGVLGFQVDLPHLHSTLLREAARIPTSPALTVSISVGGDRTEAGDTAVLVRDLAPFLTGWRIRVEPEDPNVVSSYVSRQRWIWGTTLALLLSGMVLGVALVLRDLSRERRLAQLRTDFVANVTHELKTPLTSIRMFAETLRMGRARSATERRECLEVIVGETRRLSRLINTVLDFSKIERSQKEYRLTEISFSKVVESTLHTLKYSLKEQGFTLEAELEPGVSVLGDGDALEQATLNLIDNAVKYSGRSRLVRVGLWTQEDLVFLRVSDQGIGISEADRNRVFEKFYRAEVRGGGDVGGAGLGLTVVKHIVEAHKGRIDVESRVGEGSSFTIVLPALHHGHPLESE